MVKYFLVNNASRAAAYGIGTYIKQIEDCFQNDPSLYELCVVDICSDVKEFIVDKDESGILHYRIPSYQGHGSTFPYYRYVLFLLSLYIKEEEEVIFHFNYSQHYDLIRLLKAKYRFCHVLYAIHYLDWCFILNGNLTRFRKLINNKVEDIVKNSIQNYYVNDNRLFSLCDEIIVLSEFTYDLLQTDYNTDMSKIHLIYNGMKGKPAIAYHDSEDCDKKEILFVGRLDKIKGIEYIIKAFQAITMHIKDVRLILVGDGNFSRYLSLCKGFWDKITFTGRLEREELEQFYCRATIGILASFHEQCSYSAIEMMAHGIPFIATDSTGLGEMMDYTPECLVHIDENNFQPEDFVEQLSEKMEKLLSNYQLRQQISGKLHELFKERYNLDRMRNALKHILTTQKQSDCSISSDFMPYLDNESIRLIDKRPALDLDYVGLTGIGCYLWWRIESLKDSETKTFISNSMRLQEYLIYYLDWLFDVIAKDGKKSFSSFFEPDPLNWLLNGLMDKGFYKTKVEKIIRLIFLADINICNEKIKKIDNIGIVQNMLKIYNLKL